MTATQPALNLSRLGQIALTVRDRDEAVNFYRDTLGMKFLFEYPGLAFFDCAGVRLMLSANESGKAQEACNGTALYFKVDDIQSAANSLKSHGINMESEPHLIAPMPDHDLWMAFLRDPSGNLLGLMSEVPRA